MIKTDIQEKIDVERENIRNFKAQAEYFEKQMLISSGKLTVLLEIQEEQKKENGEENEPDS